MRDLLEVVSLMSPDLSVLMVPGLGGRVLELTDLARGRQWLWRNNEQSIGPVPEGASYDDAWQGGMEELFPNDAPESFDGLSLPDHGELWSVPWRVVELSKTAMTLSVVGRVSGVEVGKSLKVDGPLLTIEYRLSNGTERLLRYLFKLHPAIDVNEGCVIDVPGGQVEKVHPSFGNLFDSTDREPWPTSSDLSRCRASDSRTSEFVYIHDVPEGWCGITDWASGSRLRIDYPLDTFGHCWVFMSYGGWRGHQVVVLEPCTNYPKLLSEAVVRGTTALLRAGEVKTFRVSFRVAEANGE